LFWKIAPILIRDALKLSIRSPKHDAGLEPSGDAAIAAALRVLSGSI
jgi:hypothetical protein